MPFSLSYHLLDVFHTPSFLKLRRWRHSFPQAANVAIPAGFIVSLFFVNQPANTFRYLVFIVDISTVEGPSETVKTSQFQSVMQTNFDSISNYTAPRDIEGIQKDIDSLENVLTYYRGDICTKAALMTNMGVLLMGRFDNEGNVSDINRAIDLQREALDFITGNDSEKAACLWNLGNSYLSRYERSGTMDDLQSAVGLHETVLSLTERSNESFSRRAGNLGISLMRRFEQTYNFSDINKAIELHEQAISSLPDGHPLLAACLINLGNAIQCRYENCFDAADIDNAIKAQEKALSLLTANDSDRPLCLTNLGNSLMQRFDQNGDMSDIDTAVSFQEEAVKLALTDDAKARRLVNLGVAYTKRFESSAELIDIDRAISAQERALELTPEVHPQKPGRLTNLGTSYTKRYERSRNIYDVLKAIPVQERAVNDTPSENKQLRAKRLTNLGASYQRLFEESQDTADINKAIGAHREAVALLYDTHPDRPLCFNNLGFSLMRRFEKSKDKADIDEAITIQRNALQLFKDDEGRRMACANNLANSLQSRFELTNNLEDLEQAIALQKDAVSSTPEGHAQMAVRINNLARSYVHRFQYSNESNDIEEAIKYYKQSAIPSTGIPSLRLEAAIGWASAALEVDPVKALDAYSVAIDLVPTVTWLGLTIPMRHVDLASLSNLSSEAAAIAISVGRYDLALEWLENGRSVVWSQLNHLRTPLDALRAERPDLAERLAQLSESLAKAGTREVFPDAASLEEDGQSHRRLAEEWNKVLSEVRTVKGFDNFMQGRKYSDLEKHLSLLPGTVAVINVCEHRCDALLLSPNDKKVHHIPLAKLSYKIIVKHQEIFAKTLDQNHLKARGARGTTFSSINEEEITNILHYLWLTCVSPILSGLKVQPMQSQESEQLVPRMWWCTTGPLSFLPIHAAGIYDDDESTGTKAYEFVVSSYTPTVGTILETLIKDSKSQTTRVDRAPTILAVSQPKTPGKSPLPGTVQEILEIKKIFNAPKQITSLDGSEATVQTVIEGMKNHPWVHLACHANQNLKQPTKSAIQLYDAGLPLSTIINTALPHADFAFLSACQTSAGSEMLSEESVHLAAGMLVAGYRSIIATMWSIRDKDGPNVAKEVYSFLFTGGNVPNSENSARALHHAMNILREEVGIFSFLNWVPFIHVGI